MNRLYNYKLSFKAYHKKHVLKTLKLIHYLLVKYISRLLNRFLSKIQTIYINNQFCMNLQIHKLEQYNFMWNYLFLTPSIPMHSHFTNWIPSKNHIRMLFFLQMICMLAKKLQHYTQFSSVPKKRHFLTVLKSPHVDKKSREQFELVVYQKNISICSPFELDLIFSRLNIYLNNSTSIMSYKKLSIHTL